ncbi:MAG: hypothetical protein V2A34_12535, partial [Lentisphaerota bacterium]
MVQEIKRFMGRVDMRVMIFLVMAGLVGSLAYAAVQLAKPAVEEPAFPTVNTWQELVKEYLAFRDSSYPLVPPDDVLADVQSLDGIDVEALQAGPEWYWTFNQNTFYFDESGELAKQITHNTELIIYEDMATDELIILSVPEKEGVGLQRGNRLSCPALAETRQPRTPR